MKKVLFALAVVALFGFVACNNNKTAEESVQDTTVAECCATEAQSCCDSNAIENAVEEVIDAAAEAISEEIAK